jgi:hypothetical protein
MLRAWITGLFMPHRSVKFACPYISSPWIIFLFVFPGRPIKSERRRSLIIGRALTSIYVHLIATTQLSLTNPLALAIWMISRHLIRSFGPACLLDYICSTPMTYSLSRFRENSRFITLLYDILWYESISSHWRIHLDIGDLYIEVMT